MQSNVASMRASGQKSVGQNGHFFLRDHFDHSDPQAWSVGHVGYCGMTTTIDAAPRAIPNIHITAL
jgi:hypothetical protein